MEHLERQGGGMEAGDEQEEMEAGVEPSSASGRNLGANMLEEKIY